DDPADVLGARAVALQPLHAALAGPAAVAVHDDRDVAWNGPELLGRAAKGLGLGCHQTSLTSRSLRPAASSTCLIEPSVSFWTRSRARRRSSCEILPSFSSFLRPLSASRRMFRTATFDSSARLRTCLARSPRRCSLSWGRA